jgi:DNA polymerase
MGEPAMAASNDLRRLIRQTLELYRGMGLEQLPLVAVPQDVAASPAPRGAAREATVTSNKPRANPSTAPWERPSRPATSLPETAARSAPSATLFSMEPASVSPSTPVTRPAPVPLPVQSTREERASALTVLQDVVVGCQRCPELASSRTNTVFGVGDPAAKILFLGEAPGADEDAQGEPFVGRAGQLLNDIITACRLRREEIYICNVLKCRPPGNRTPLEGECLNCREFLDGQLAAIDPEYIVCWGTTAAQNLLQTKQPIGKLRQQFFRHGRAKVVCTYHPSYLLRNPPAKKDVWEDMKFWRLEMGIDVTQVKKSG